MSSFLKRTQTLVNKATNVQDLITILQHIPLQNIKDFINESLRPMTENTIKSIHIQSSSIHDIISDDIMQSIISYIPHQYSLKYINKDFNKFMHKISELRMRLRNNNISSQFKCKNIWVVDPLRNNLTTEEITTGKKGPIESLDKALDLMESGDKIILSKGTHQIKKKYFHHKDVQIEGMGKDSIIRPSDDETYDHDLSDYYFISKKLSLSNLRLDHIFWFYDINGGHVWLTDCIFSSDVGLRLKENAKLDCVKCQFVGDDVCGSAIDIVGSSKISIIDCLFDHFGQECCDELHGEPTIRIENYWNHIDNTSLKIIRNTFRNMNDIYPIGGEESVKIEVNDESILRHNKFDCDKSDMLYYFLKN